MTMILDDVARLQGMKPQGIVFLCVANSARSQLAEGIARSLAPDGVRVFSAGSTPGQLRPEAVAVLAEIGLDISAHRAKGVGEIPAEAIDLVITLCAQEFCPMSFHHAEHVHWALPDPAGAGDGDHLEAFRQVRDELRRRFALVWPSA
jgi:protein-tyrosine-phosphatase